MLNLVKKKNDVYKDSHCDAAIIAKKKETTNLSYYSTLCGDY